MQRPQGIALQNKQQSGKRRIKTLSFFRSRFSKCVQKRLQSKTILYIYRRKIPTIKIVKNRLYNSNNRAVIGEYGNVAQVTNYYPFGGVFSTTAYNSGDDLQPYKYNGKELDRTHGLDWYDYGARQYDPFVPGFTSLDPMCEKYYNVSPYVYCENDPINAFDPDGRSGVKVLLKAAYKIGKTAVKHGGKSLTNAATYADAFAGVVDDVQTLTSSESSVGEKIFAGVSLASEFLPVSVGDIKDAGKIVDTVVDTASDGNKMAKLHKKAEIGQEAHRQIEREIVQNNPGAIKEKTIELESGQKVRKDVVGADGKTVYIIKPNTKSEQRAAQKRANLMENNGYKPESFFMTLLIRNGCLGLLHTLDPKNNICFCGLL